MAFDDYCHSAVHDFGSSASYSVPQTSYRKETSSSYRNPKSLRVIAPRRPAKTPSAATAVGVERTFLRLANAMDERHAASSKFEDFHSSEEYLSIIGLGPAVVPCLLRDLQRTGRPWFLALASITRQKVGQDIEPGNVRALAQSWLQWGRDNQIL